MRRDGAVWGSVTFVQLTYHKHGNRLSARLATEGGTTMAMLLAGASVHDITPCTAYSQSTRQDTAPDLLWNFHGTSMEVPNKMWNFHTPRLCHLSAIWEAASITPQSPGRYVAYQILNN